MLEILQNLISIMTNDATLNAMVPASQIFTGDVDIVTETQSGLQLPQINIHVITETTNSVPTYTRNTDVQIDIWSRNSQIEVINVYERILALLEYDITNQGSAHVFWYKMNGAVDINETDRRIWHRAATLKAWTQKINS